ncbi:NADH dehydrogenase [Leuconostoc gasicomitatum]|uniref:Rhodanese-like domain protein n=2 Tax=Leuconostoc TaxID=1243 RepID=A0AAN2UH09_9LACO|nr:MULTISPECIES: rhodanese-like domain-containing protein [Leuconostoc]MBZ5956275.1 rhodanese-like domain-containing protein [Leuconostoc gasicomitatum]MBZ5959315.1 rhodanese-like domain-containing protein [Leuconostoc gasicomitatum]MBZ5959913.1 rhodanese-like domain-containing protein [Leuconostoc gasicomitatum]MBZ5962247.1 rhodanese-like domain-containing protein [Leuconostoc gasicomitatum]MBZ5966554.1 rhodanese-like domain-containing protein [Leuconostoc gasicomitatum]
MNLVTTVIIVVVVWGLVALGSWLWVLLSAKTSAVLLKPIDFSKKVANENGQIVDVRESAAYKRSHIMGARNIPMANFSQGKSGLRKDRDIFLYDERLRDVARVGKSLKKQGYHKSKIFILRGGFSQYDGKTTK